MPVVVIHHSVIPIYLTRNANTQSHLQRETQLLHSYIQQLLYPPFLLPPSLSSNTPHTPPNFNTFRSILHINININPTTTNPKQSLQKLTRTGDRLMHLREHVTDVPQSIVCVQFNCAPTAGITGCSCRARTV